MPNRDINIIVSVSDENDGDVEGGVEDVEDVEDVEGGNGDVDTVWTDCSPILAYRVGKIEIMSGNRVDGVGVIISNCFFVGSTGRVGAIVVS